MDKNLQNVLETIDIPQNLNLTQNERRSIIDDKLRDLILKGKSRKYCLTFIKSESERLGYTLSDSQTSHIYQNIKSEIKSELSENQDEILADIASKLYWLYNQNIEKDDLREARECIKEVARLCGAASNKVNIENDKITIEFA